jgi:hypothetical protein
MPLLGAIAGLAAPEGCGASSPAAAFRPGLTKKAGRRPALICAAGDPEPQALGCKRARQGAVAQGAVATGL